MTEDAELENSRLEVLEHIEELLETPMLVLGFLWLLLLVVDLVWGLAPLLLIVSDVIWVIFIVDFLVRFLLAPRKVAYLRGNVLTAVSLLLPALRVLRIVRLFRFMRGVRLVRILTSLNRGIRATRASMDRRGFGYVAALVLLVTTVGAAGMFAFERNAEGGFDSYGEALWWTAMLLTSIGSEYWPQTAEGRVLCLLLSIFGFAIFGYVTAALASLFIDRDAASAESEVASDRSVQALREEIRALRSQFDKAISQRP